MIGSAIMIATLALTAMVPASADAQRRKRPTASTSAPRKVASRGVDGAYFANCSQARAAGAAPVRRGDPGYSRKLDRDGDGIGCE